MILSLEGEALSVTLGCDDIVPYQPIKLLTEDIQKSSLSDMHGAEGVQLMRS
jgi:hypothetical protein